MGKELLFVVVVVVEMSLSGHYVFSSQINIHNSLFPNIQTPDSWTVQHKVFLRHFLKG